MKGWLIGLLALGAFGMTIVSAKRGIRNKNPGNLRVTNIPWYGKVAIEDNTDGEYEQFVNHHWGLRAMAMDLRNDIEKDGTNTLRKLVAEYAPKSENPTTNYINFLSNRLGILPGNRLEPKHYGALIKGIIQFENGENPYSDDDIERALQDSYNNYA